MTQLANTRTDITVAPQKSTERRRTCLGIKTDGTHCHEILEAIDAGERLCLDCRELNKRRRGGHSLLSAGHRRMVKGEVY